MEISIKSALCVHVFVQPREKCAGREEDDERGRDSRVVHVDFFVSEGGGGGHLYLCKCVCVRIEREREKVKRVKVFIITRRVFPAQSEGTVFFVNHDFISENEKTFVIIIAGMNAYF